MYPQTESQGQHFSVALSGIEEERLVGDPLRINQILLNLLSNARKFTPEGGSIKLEVSQKRKNGGVLMRFTVSDTGIGLSEAFQKRLFKPFEQADSSISQKYGGTGLGLAITHNLVTLMNGTIGVRSKEHEGSCFTVELPLALPPNGHIQKKEQIARDMKVLVVDDDLDTCEYAALILRRMGIAAKWVLTAREALDQVVDAHERGNDYDVCLIDWKMPEMDGIEATRRIREVVGPETLIIIITAYDWTSIEQRAREAGANAFLSKPLFSSALYHTLSAVSQKKPASAAAELEPGTEGQAPSLRGRHVLLVEDNDLNREITEEILKMKGVSFTCAENGQIAVDIFTASAPGTFDAILMDIQMPVLDGYAATAAIRASHSPESQAIPIIPCRRKLPRHQRTFRQAGQRAKTATPPGIPAHPAPLPSGCRASGVPASVLSAAWVPAQTQAATPHEAAASCGGAARRSGAGSKNALASFPLPGGRRFFLPRFAPVPEKSPGAALTARLRCSKRVC